MDSGTDRLLLFSIGSHRFALELLSIAEVLPPPVMFPVPLAPAYLKGAINFHGNLVAVVDLAQILDIGTMAVDCHVLVLDRGIANLGFGVNAVDSIIPAGDILEHEESINPLVEKVLFLPDGEVSKLALDLLLERISETLQR